MNLREFCDKIDTKTFVEKYKSPYKEEWTKRTGVLDVHFPISLEGVTMPLPVATDAIHTLNMLRSYTEPIDISTLSRYFFTGSGYPSYHIQTYLEVFAKLGIVEAIGEHKKTTGKVKVIGPPNNQRQYVIRKDALEKCQVSSLRPAPIDVPFFISTNIRNGMELSIGGETYHGGEEELLKEIYPEI